MHSSPQGGSCQTLKNASPAFAAALTDREDVRSDPASVVREKCNVSEISRSSLRRSTPGPLPKKCPLSTGHSRTALTREQLRYRDPQIGWCRHFSQIAQRTVGSAFNFVAGFRPASVTKASFRSTRFFSCRDERLSTFELGANCQTFTSARKRPGCNSLS
jgi:hypothetical protein